MSERCPLGPGHADAHEIESETARRERLARAAATHPGEVLVAVDAVIAWLASVGGPEFERTFPARELWTVIDVAEAAATQAMASLDTPTAGPALDQAGVRTDG